MYEQLVQPIIGMGYKECCWSTVRTEVIMNLKMDLHTHTLASGHAYSTLEENIRAAKERGLQYYGISDHAVGMPGAAHTFYFMNMRIIPREIHGMKVLRGVEANIVNYQGQIDMVPESLRFIDYVIASAHIPCLKPGTVDEHMSAYIGAMENPKVNIIGHPDDTRYPVDYEQLALAAKKNNVMLEVNNTSLNPNGFRVNARENIINMLKMCKKHEVDIILGSDAHISPLVGEFGYAMEILTEMDFPEELVINCYPEKFLELIGFTK